MEKARLMPCVGPVQVIEFWRVLPSSGLMLSDESVETVEKVDGLNLTHSLSSIRKSVDHLQ
jgi:hypothetical protein